MILAVKIKKVWNPFRPLSYIDRGHVDITLWEPPKLPQTFGFYPKSEYHGLFSILVPQQGQLVKNENFTPIPSYWHIWNLSKIQYESIERYLEEIVVGCANGSVRYEGFRFNCMHVAYSCLKVANLNPPTMPVHRVWLFHTTLPLTFIKAFMPNARYSIIDHEIHEVIE